MNLTFPDHIQRLLEMAAAQPDGVGVDLGPVQAWLNDDGSDVLGMSVQSPGVFLADYEDVFTDSELINYGWADKGEPIADSLRVEFARDRLQHALDEPNWSVHAWDFISTQPHKSVLCFLAEGSAASGDWMYRYMGVYDSFENFLSVNQLLPELVMNPKSLSADQILARWH